MKANNARYFYEFQVLYLLEDEFTKNDSIEKIWYSSIDLYSVSAYSMLLDGEGNPYADRTCLTLDSGIEFTVMMPYEDVAKLINKSGA